MFTSQCCWILYSDWSEGIDNNNERAKQVYINAPVLIQHSVLKRGWIIAAKH